jgi:ubiquinone/menaquinone biosynthesis C-methylase UbiE
LHQLGVAPQLERLPGKTELGDVRSFWNTEACGSQLVHVEKGTADFYAQYREVRYRVEWHIPLLVPFSETVGKKVLEIGCGNGADGTLFARAGADYTGVDLTDAAIEASRKHFEVLGLKGTFQIENAERLSFPDDSFDFVYSYGVLHHTAHPLNAFSEVRRVLKTGGRAVLMLYHKHSFNYYVRILTYMRLRVLWQIVKHTNRLARDRAELTRELKGVRGNTSPSVWQVHYENFLRTGWSYLSASNFVHHATDGPECPFAHAYTRKQIQELFHNFSGVHTTTAHFPLRKYPAIRWLPLRLERQVASIMGWYLIIFLSK